MGFSEFLAKVFEDKRLAICVVVVWSVILISVMLYINLLQSDFVTIGPSSHTKIMTMNIDTWHKYLLLSSAAIINCAIHDFVADSIHPWILNTIQDHKTIYLPYNKSTCYVIYQIWITYCHLMGVFSWSFMIAQIDFTLMRLFVDLVVKTYTTYKFLKHKVTDKQMYSIWNEDKLLHHTLAQEDLSDIFDEKVSVLVQS